MGKAIIVSVVLLVLLSSFVAAESMTLGPVIISPDTVTITQGDSVTFTNENSGYSVLRIRLMYYTSDRINAGDSLTVFFDDPGSYQVIDVVFSGVGTVNVLEREEPFVEAPQDIQEDNAACPEIYQPVCGDNGQTYSNECFSEVANIAVDCAGECPCAAAPVQDLPPTPPEVNDLSEPPAVAQPPALPEEAPTTASADEESAISQFAMAVILLVVLLAVGGAFLLAGKDKKKPVEHVIPPSAAQKPRKKRK